MSVAAYNKERALRADRNRRRPKTEYLGIRIGCLVFALCTLVGLSTLGVFDETGSLSSDLSLGSSYRRLSEAGCATEAAGEFCTNVSAAGEICEEPEGFGFSCCRVAVNTSVTGTSQCISHDEAICLYQDLCKAELVPGGNGAAECLPAFALRNNRWNGILLYTFVLLYLFVALAIVVDDYFVSSLDRIGEALNLSEDVNGATFAAAGSSAPELFVSLADNVLSNPPKSLGIGTIVGSAIFNILVIIGLSAARANQKLALDWRPISRDSTFYAFSIIALVLAVHDGEVQWYEGMLLVFCYLGYITFMKYNTQFWDYMDKRFNLDPMKGQVSSRTLGHTDDGKIVKVDSVNGETEHRRVSLIVPRTRAGSYRGVEGGIVIPQDPETGSLDLPPYFDSLQWPIYRGDLDPDGRPNIDAPKETWFSRNFGHNREMWRSRLYFLIVFPLNLCFRFTIPDSNYDVCCEDRRVESKVQTMIGDDDMEIERIDGTGEGGETKTIVENIENRKIAYSLSFVICVIWIALLSHILVYAATKFGCFAGIPPEVMGLTILAAGTSVPDAMTSIAFAKQGKGNMAIANSIGSNVFDILLGLGLPWFIAGVAFNKPVPIAVDGLVYSVVFLFGVLAVLIGVLIASGWELGSRVGYFLACLYLIYVGIEAIKVFA